MKTAKFKKKISIKQKIMISITITALMCIYFVNIITTNISESLIFISKRLIIRETDIIYNNIFTDENLENIDTDSLMTIIKNSKDEIIEVEFDISMGEKILTKVVNAMNKETGKYLTEGYMIDVPLGYIAQSPLLVNLGPKIPIKIVALDVIFGNVKTRITEYGINNALVDIYLELNLKINAALPSTEETYTFSYNYLLASKIINGKVPDFYGGVINKESKNFNLPITENL